MKQFNDAHATGLVAQCMKPITITNPVCTTEKVTVTFNRPVEGSGSVLTTILNHMASVFIAISSAVLICDDIEWAITNGAMYVGHNITIDMCNHEGEFIVEKMQFLKHSYMECDDGIYRAKRNIGCTLRSLGSIDKILEPVHLGVTTAEFSQMTDLERMDRFIGSVIAAEIHQPECFILSALRKRFPPITSTVFLDTCERHNFVCGSDSTVTLESMCRRYNFNAALASDFIELLMHLTVGDCVGHSILSQIYSVDYGL
jgi:hypothetical protein